MALDTTLQPAPVCPYCGKVHKDAWEWPDDGIYECHECGEEFAYERVVTVDYTTKALKVKESGNAG